MLSPVQKRGTCGHVMAVVDNHRKCARCRDKGVDDDLCVKKQECKICKALMLAQLKQLSTPTYQSRKERDLKKSSDSPASVSPTLVDPADVSVLGRVHKESDGSSDSKKKADPSPTPKANSKKKSSSKSRSDDIKDLDEKWSEWFSRLEAMLVSKMFTVPMNPVQNPPSVVTSDQPFFDPGTSTNGLSSGVTVGGTGSSLVQTTGEAAVVREAVNKSATSPVEAPGAGTATQPVEAHNAGPKVLPTGSAALHAELTGSDSEEEFQSEPGSPIDGNARDGSPDLTRNESADQELSEESTYRETIRGVWSFLGWHQIPEFDIVSSTDDHPFASSRAKPTRKVSVKLPVDDWLCRKMEKLNLTIEGYPSKNTQTAGLLRDQFVKTPRSSRRYNMQADKKESDSSAANYWSPELAKLNNAFSRVARRCLPTAPHSRAFSQDILRRWERAAREQSIMCNQAAGLSCCLTKVQHEMFTQIKNLHSVKGKGRSSERTQQTVDELEYLLTFNHSISQAMARTMQDLSEGVFISAHRDSYLEYLHASVKQDTLHCVLLPFICSHFSRTGFSSKLKRKSPDLKRGVLLATSTGNRGVSTLMLPMTEFHNNWTGSHPSQLGSQYTNVSRERKVVASLPLSHRNQPRVQKNVNDNYCVQSVTGLKDFACVPGHKSLNPSPVMEKKV